MDHWGRMEGDPTIAAVLAQAAMSAAIDLGQRSALGECQEIALTYAGGAVLATGTADGHILLFQHASDSPMDLLRQRARGVLAALDEPQEEMTAQTGSAHGLMDALNAAQP